MFNIILLHCWVHVYTIFKDTFRKSYIHYVSMYFHTIYENIFTQTQPVDGIFSKMFEPIFIQNSIFRSEYSFVIFQTPKELWVQNKFGSKENFLVQQYFVKEFKKS